VSVTHPFLFQLGRVVRTTSFEAKPTGKMVFTVLGAVAELERSLIVERVRAGLRNAVAKGKKLGRPRCNVDATRIAQLRAAGRSWRKIARAMGVSAKTCRRAGQKGTLERLRPDVDKNPESEPKVTA